MEGEGLSMRLIETHAHIYASEFKEDIDTVISNAKRDGIERIYMPNIDSESIVSMLEVEERFPGFCIPTIGLHPCYVKENFEDELRIMEEWLQRRAFVAIGEIGIDLYWDKTFVEQQKQALKIQTEWAKEREIPIIIHARDSIEEILEVLEPLNSEKMTGVFHCFSGNLDQAQRVIDLGFVLGIGGVSTFKNGGLDKVIPSIDVKHLVLETDCPYLAPVPYRGKRNEPAYVKLVAQRVADLKEVSIEIIAEATSKNADRLFQYDQGY